MPRRCLAQAAEPAAVVAAAGAAAEAHRAEQPARKETRRIIRIGED